MRHARAPWLVLHDNDGMERLLLDLSVSVTAMFRDPSFYVTFREHVVPLLSEAEPEPSTFETLVTAARQPACPDCHGANVSRSR